MTSAGWAPSSENTGKVDHALLVGGRFTSRNRELFRAQSSRGLRTAFVTVGRRPRVDTVAGNLHDARDVPLTEPPMGGIVATKKRSGVKQPKATKDAQAATSPTPSEASASAEAAKPMAKKAAKSKRRARRKATKKTAKAKAKPVPSKKSPKGRTSRRKRYTPAEKAKILAAARSEGLTGAQVAKRFGVSALSYYTWRKKAGAPKRRGPKPGPRPAVTRAGRSARDATNIAELLRREIRAQIDRMLPQILQSEVGSALSGNRGRRSSRR